MARDTHERMLVAAGRLLQSRGFHGTALNDVLERSGAPRGSLYFHFPEGKAQLALEATQAAIIRLTEDRAAAVAGATSPAGAVRAVAAEIARSLVESDYSGGCPVSPLVMDGDTRSDALEALCRDTFAIWADRLEEAFLAGGVQATDARGLALLSLSTFQGSLILARAARDVAPVVQAADQLARMIERTT